MTLESWMNASFVERSFFSYVPQENLAEVFKHTDQQHWKKGVVAQRGRPSEYLYIVYVGEVGIKNESGLQVGAIKSGRSIELMAVIEDRENWKYKWVCEEDVSVLRVKWETLKAAIRKDSVKWFYLKRMSQSVGLQKLKNEMLALAIPRTAIFELIANMQRATVREVLSDWTQKVFLVLVNGELRVRAQAGTRELVLLHLRTMDSALLDLPRMDVEIEGDDEATVWFIREAKWMSLKHQQSLQTYFGLFYTSKRRSMIDSRESDKTIVMSGYATKNSSHKNSRIMDRHLSVQDDHRAERSMKPLFDKLRLLPGLSEVGGVDNSGFVALVNSARFYGFSISIDQILLTCSGSDLMRSLPNLRSLALDLGFDCTIEQVDSFTEGTQICIVPFIDEYVVLVRSRGGMSTILDAISGYEKQISTRVLDQKRSGKEVLSIRGVSPRREYIEQVNLIPQIVRYLNGMFWTIGLLVAVGSFSFILIFNNAFFHQVFFDSFNGSVAPERAYLALGVAFAVSAVGVFVNYWIDQVIQFLSFRASLGSFKGAIESIAKMPKDTVERIGAGQIVGRMSSLDEIGPFIAGALAKAPAQVIVGMVGIGLLFQIQTTLAQLMLAAVGVQVVVMFLMKNRYQQTTYNLSSIAGLEKQFAIEHLSHSFDLQTLGAEVSVRWRWDRVLAAKARLEGYQAVWNSIYDGLSAMVRESARLGLFWFAAVAFSQGMISYGQLISASLIGSVIVGSIQSIGGFGRDAIRIAGHVRRTSLFVGPANEEGLAGSGFRRLKGDIEFSKVTYAYQVGHAPALKNITFKISAGSRVCVVGHSGSGKSTLAGLFNGLRQPISGEIRIDGISVRSIPEKALRRQVGLVEQEGDLFLGTILDNISLFEKMPTKSRVLEAASVAELDQFVLGHPDGYLRELAIMGEGLSQGQKQRILIARLVYMDPAIVVLDEATSNLDALTEDMLFEKLLQRFKDRTVVILTQRINAAIKSDVVLYLEAGELVEQGAHHELIEKRGDYYRFFSKFVGLGV